MRNKVAKLLRKRVYGKDFSIRHREYYKDASGKMSLASVEGHTKKLKKHTSCYKEQATPPNDSRQP